MGCHRSRVQYWLSHPEESTLFHVAMIKGAQFCFCDDLEDPDIEQRSTHPSFSMSLPTIFHGWNGNTQLSRTRNIDDAMRLVICLAMLIRRISKPDYKPWYALLMLSETHLRHDFRVHNVCHWFVLLDQNEASHVFNFSIYWNMIFSQSCDKMKLKKRPITFNQSCNSVWLVCPIGSGITSALDQASA